MAVTGRSTGDLVATLTEAPFVRVAPRADGDAIAAAGLLLRALDERSIPFQARAVVPTADPPTDEATVPIGFADGPFAGERPASAEAADLVRELGSEPDMALALAGCHAAGIVPSAAGLDVPFERHEGVGIPTADPTDGLAHSTLVHADFSGDETATTDALADLADDEGRGRGKAIASFLALETVGAEGATPRAAERVERALRPHATPDGPFETVEGYADVLDCLADEAPGIALALAMGHDVSADALDVWRVHSEAAHRGLREATTDRYDGLFVARIDVRSGGSRGPDPDPERESTSDGTATVPLETIARLLRDFRSPEPVALVVSEHRAAAASGEGASIADLGDAIATAANASDGIGGGTAIRATAEFDAEPMAFIDAVREAI